MCGIVGVSDRVLDDPASVVERMNGALTHRGPDDSGTASFGSTVMAMRRLSVVDLEGGHQPMSTPDGRFTIIVNGELYDHAAARRDLVRDGVELRTRSDTEVLLHLLARDGTAALDRCNGMYALCLHDRRDGSLLLARDASGQKPLFWWADGDRLAFSSELPSLLEHPGIERRIDHEALASYLRLWFVPAPLTMVRDVRQLLPGQWLRWRDGEITTGRTTWAGAGRGGPITDDVEAVDAVRSALVTSVRRHLVADVPVGVFLSGGVDSAAVAAAAVRASDGPVSTFTVAWSDPTYDESGDAAQVAAHLGTDHHELAVTAGGFDPDAFDRVVAHMGQPLADNSLLPTYLLCHHARRHVTVALGGDGGDEVFAGYFDLVNASRVAAMARLPELILRAGAWGLGKAATVPQLASKDGLRVGRRALAYAALDVPERLWEMTALMGADELVDLVRGRHGDADMAPVRDLLGPLDHLGPLRQMLRYRSAVVLADQMLVKSDRMSMASSLELRAPLLDRELVAVAERLEDRHLVRRSGGRRVGKWVLREAIRPWVPPSVLSGPKRGFGAPLAALRNQAFADRCGDLVLARDGIMDELFDRPVRERIVGRVLDGERGSAAESEYRINAQLWALLVLAAWLDRFGVTT